ncbi:hypothetical protein C8R43DRAFT_1130994 [Mycena crocata]|nr:hypothetical protein C8R43DRAFT_1130994 [Mycena crocata]
MLSLKYQPRHRNVVPTPNVKVVFAQLPSFSVVTFEKVGRCGLDNEVCALGLRVNVWECLPRTDGLGFSATQELSSEQSWAARAASSSATGSLAATRNTMVCSLIFLSFNQFCTWARLNRQLTHAALACAFFSKTYMYEGFYGSREYVSVRREQLGGDVPALKRVFSFSLVLMFFEHCAQTVDAQFNSVAPTRRSGTLEIIRLDLERILMLSFLRKNRRKRVSDVSPRSSNENVFQSKQTLIRGLAAPYRSSERYIGMCHEAGIDGAPLRRLAALARQRRSRSSSRRRGLVVAVVPIRGDIDAGKGFVRPRLSSPSWTPTCASVVRQNRAPTTGAPCMLELLSSGRFLDRLLIAKPTLAVTLQVSPQDLKSHTHRSLPKTTCLNLKS